VTSRTVVVVIAAIVVVAIFVAMASSSLTADDGDAHRMPDGSTMQGDQMP
jgi:hypothetical protein